MSTGKCDCVILREICDLVNDGYTARAKPEPIGPKFLRITDLDDIFRGRHAPRYFWGLGVSLLHTSIYFYLFYGRRREQWRRIDPKSPRRSQTPPYPALASGAA